MASIFKGLLIAFYGLMAAILTAIGAAITNFHPTDQVSTLALASLVPVLTGLIAAGVHFFVNLGGTPPPATTSLKEKVKRIV